MTMKSARIAQFKAKLSSYLRYVKKGEVVTIYDREVPIADVVPHNKAQDIFISEANGDLSEVWKKPSNRAGILKKTNSVEILLGDRKR